MNSFVLLCYIDPLPSLDAAVQEILLEEKRLGIVSALPSDVALAITHLRRPNGTSLCKNCKLHDHKFANCPTTECRYCHKRGHILDYCPTRPPRPSGHSQKPKFSSKTGSPSVVVAATPSDITPPSSLQLTDLHDLLKQVISSNSTALAVTPGTSWLLDSACCNHMTSNISLLFSHIPIHSLPPIHSIDGNHMSISHIGTVNTPTIKLSNTYHVPNLTFKLASVGQLCDVGLTIVFSSHGCQVQDSQTGQVIGTERKVGRLFELTSLQHSPMFPAISAPATDDTICQWHLRLGHTSSDKLRSLASNGLLNNVSKFSTLDCLNCKLAKQHALSFPNSASLCDKHFGLIHSDIWGPAPCSTEYGIDYEETFAPVARMTSVRSLLAIAAAKQWSLLQMDVKNVFLNGTLSEEVYMKPPSGITPPPQKVCLLRCALYGLKQAPRAWFATFSSTITQLGFTSSTHDSALFTHQTSTGLGNLSYFLSLEISSLPSGYYLSQAKYASDLINRSGISDSATSSTPLDPNVRLTPFDGVPLEDPTLYRQLVGSLIYLTVTRPDISYAVHIASQFMTAPRTIHFTAVLRILRYIKGTLGHGDPTDQRSTTGYCLYLGDTLISWRSKKQSVVSRSSTESEYRALTDATSELLWLRWLLTDMGGPQTSPTILHCDNRTAIQIACNDVFHEQTKHIENGCHFVCHHLHSNTLHLKSISTTDQPADIFTKALHSPRFTQLIHKLKVVSTLPS
ncbi:hypothetical protein IC575_019275 [Cucumis melo]